MLLQAVIDAMSDRGFRPQVKTERSLADVVVADATHDSRQAQPGHIFCAVTGGTHDGHSFVSAAAQAGCEVALVERWVDVDVVQLRVQDTRRAMAPLAAAVHRNPSRDLGVFGITGTNGKTTTATLLGSVMSQTGSTVEVIGTIGGSFTTPESTDFQRMLRSAADSGVNVVAAEISSHGLDQHRADAIDFDVAAFSNLTADHLDYHLTMEAYFEAKARLFDGRARHELINVDDPWGARLAELRPNATKVSLESVEIISQAVAATTFVWRNQTVHLPIPGLMNVANALLAAESALRFGLDASDVAQALAETPQVAGRMEIVTGHDRDLTVIVDYSHTPAGIEAALAAIRTSSRQANIAIVFGCGGDRDRSKRPMMGAAAEAGADLVVITSDNPRSEDPDAIIAEALTGLSEPHAAVVEPDRRRAIAAAIDRTPAGGVVLIAGKGHERTQTVGSAVLDFDDVAVAQELLAGETS